MMKLRNFLSVTFLILSGCIDSNPNPEDTHPLNSPSLKPASKEISHTENTSSETIETQLQEKDILSKEKTLSQQSDIQTKNTTPKLTSSQPTISQPALSQPNKSQPTIKSTLFEPTEPTNVTNPSSNRQSTNTETQLEPHTPKHHQSSDNKIDQKPTIEKTPKIANPKQIINPKQVNVSDKINNKVEVGMKIIEISSDKDVLNYYNPQKQAMYGNVKVLGISEDPRDIHFKEYAPTYYQNGLIKREIIRLQEPDLDKYPHLTTIDLIDVTRNYTWDLNSSDKKHMTNCSINHQVDGIKVYSVKTCTMVIPKDALISGKVEEHIYYGKNDDYNSNKIEFKVTKHITKNIQLNNHEIITDCVYRGSKKGQSCSFKDINSINNDDGYFKDSYDGIISQSGLDLFNEIKENPEKESNQSSRSYWNSNYHHSNDKLITLSQDLIRLLNRNNQEKSPLKDKMVAVILDYIKAHNFHYGTRNNDDKSHKANDKLHNALTELSTHEDFLKPWIRSGIAQKGYSLITHGLFQNKYFSNTYANIHLKKLLDILDFYHKSSESIRGVDVFESSIHESLKMILYSADNINYTGTNTFYKNHNSELINKISDLGNSNLIYWRKSPYRSTNSPLQNFNSDNLQDEKYTILTSVIDALYRVHDAVKNLHNPEDFNQSGFTSKIDEAITSILITHKLTNDSNPYGSRFSLVKNLMINKYLKDTGRNPKTLCSQNTQKNKTFSDVCEHITQSSLMQSPYSCNDDGTGPVIHLQKHPNLIGKQSYICQKLQVQEERFFNAFNLNTHTPVIDDHNDRLQVFIFSSPGEWKLLGSLFFKVPTNNGGIYMEGNPKNQRNIPKFYAYAADWFKEFHIWNLEHEYTHYLDGRYNQYGAYGHYPINKTTWWTEGVAEYLAHDKCFHRGLNTITNHIKQNLHAPSLETILKTDYASGSDMIYSWSYSVHRFLNERNIAPSIMSGKPHHSLWLTLAQTLRMPDKSQAEKHYDGLIKDLINNHSEEYQQWVSTALTDWWNDYQDSECPSH